MLGTTHGDEIERAGREVGYAESLIATAAGPIAGLSISVPAGGRALRVEVLGHITSTGATDTVEFQIKVDGTLLRRAFAYVPVASGYVSTPLFARMAPSTVARVVTVEVQRFSGAGAASAQGLAGYPITLSIQEI